jgi:modification methylase
VCTTVAVLQQPDLRPFVPEGLGDLSDPQKAIPRIAKDRQLTALIEQALPGLPTTHRLQLGDARQMNLAPESVHLVLTSPPYWTLAVLQDIREIPSSRRYPKSVFRFREDQSGSFR